MNVQRLVESILELDQVERIEFVEMMKNRVKEWKDRCVSELIWMEKLQDLGFKEEKSEQK